MNVLHFLTLSGIGGIERQFQRFIKYFGDHREEYSGFTHSVLSYSRRMHPDLKDDVVSNAAQIEIFRGLFPDFLWPSRIRPARCARFFDKHAFDALITTSMLTPTSGHQRSSL